MKFSSSISITGSGVICCAGKNPEELWQNILQNRSGLQNGLGVIPNETIQPAARALQFALTAARQAMDQAGWTTLNSDDGILLATTTGSVLAWDQSLARYFESSMEPLDFRRDFSAQPLANLLTQICETLGGTEHRQVISSACTASTQALALASLWIQQGKVRRCLVGGVEVLCDLTKEGFRSLQLLSTETAKPFETNRQGINLSEGAGFVCLEKDVTKDRCLATISGIGLSTDAYHMTSPHPEGKGSQQAIGDALKSAQISPAEIDWIHVHGTGSVFNDLSEGLAINSVFGNQSPLICSTKSIHGHALGASGLIETVVCLQALRNQTLLRSPGLQEPDPKIPVHHPESAATHTRLRHILKSTLGFGGANAALVFSSPESSSELEFQ